ncbi:MAG: tRNA glutamyl-Q(34) synthetase GluQRS [Burkholderiales bacterium]
MRKSPPMTAYRGRFAPSPTGPLHFGSLVAAVASYCEARVHGGEWLLRMEDLDTPRTAPGAADDILRTLERLGFAWDGEVISQSRRAGAYAQALEHLRTQGRVFPCSCSRKEISDSTLNVDGERVYPGTCKHGLAPGREARALRLRVGDEALGFEDAIQGPVRQDLARVIGDFVLRRADGIHAYQLAVVVDDAKQGITDIVRGADLLASTPRQILLQRLLATATPNYAHVPVAINARGEKLSKQTLAAPINSARGVEELVRALRFLGQAPPESLFRSSIDEVWAWALQNWGLAKVPRQRALAVND